MLRSLVIVINLFIISSCGTYVEISKSPEVIRAIYDSGTSSCYLSFKRDSTFEWFSGSALGAADSYQGRYLLPDSIIYLDNLGFDNVVKSKRLLLTTMHPLPMGLDGNYLTQIDSLNRLVDSIFIFMVSVDKRDSLKVAAHNTSFPK